MPQFSLSVEFFGNSIPKPSLYLVACELSEGNWLRAVSSYVLVYCFTLTVFSPFLSVFSRRTCSSPKMCLGFTAVHSSGAHHIREHWHRMSCGAWNPHSLLIHTLLVWDHFTVDITVWRTHAHAGTHTFTTDIPAFICVMPNIIIGFSIQRNDLPVMPGLHYLMQRMLTSICHVHSGTEELQQQRLVAINSRGGALREEK